MINLNLEFDSRSYNMTYIKNGPLNIRNLKWNILISKNETSINQQVTTHSLADPTVLYVWKRQYIDEQWTRWESSSNFQQDNTKLLAKYIRKLWNRDNLHLKFIGDSITFGTAKGGKVMHVNYDSDLAPKRVRVASKTYPDVCTKFLSRMHYGKQLKNNDKLSYENLGKPLFTASDYIEHMFEIKESDLTTIAFGLNDSKESDAEAKFYETMSILIESEVVIGNPVVLISPLNRSDGRWFTGPERIIIDRLASKYGCPVFDGQELSVGFSSSHYSDKSHLNTIGYYNYGRSLAAFLSFQSITNPIQNSSNRVIDGVANHAPIFPLRAKNGFDLFSPGVQRLQEYKGEDQPLYRSLTPKAKLFIPFYNQEANTLAVPQLSIPEGVTVEVTSHFDLQSSANWLCSDNTDIKRVSPWHAYYHNPDTDEQQICVNSLLESNSDIRNIIHLPQPGWYILELQLSNYTEQSDTAKLYGLEFIDELQYSKYTNQPLCRIDPIYNIVYNRPQNPVEQIILHGRNQNELQEILKVNTKLVSNYINI